ncbi:MAG: hypothetical protein PUF83_05115, partial [Intestinibaculum porci]|uniref:hypothetical protein n=1 Tax=Intestinibaculum porci TaxID=2487118 RepID=UPI002409E0BE
RNFLDNQKTKVYRYIDHKKKIRDNNNGLKISKRLSAIVEYGILIRNEAYGALDDAYYWNTRKQEKKSE